MEDLSGPDAFYYTKSTLAFVKPGVNPTTAAAGSSAVIQGPLQEVQGHQGLPVRGVY